VGRLLAGDSIGLTEHQLATAALAVTDQPRRDDRR
jgi:hypothetical protein